MSLFREWCEGKGIKWYWLLKVREYYELCRILKNLEKNRIFLRYMLRNIYVKIYAKAVALCYWAPFQCSPILSPILSSRSGLFVFSQFLSHCFSSSHLFSASLSFLCVPFLYSSLSYFCFGEVSLKRDVNPLTLSSTKALGPNGVFFILFSHSMSAFLSALNGMAVDYSYSFFLASPALKEQSLTQIVALLIWWKKRSAVWGEHS